VELPPFMAATMTIRPGPRPQRIEPGVRRNFHFPISGLGGCQESEIHLTRSSFPSRCALKGVEFQTAVSNRCLNSEQAGKSSQSILNEHTKIVETNSKKSLKTKEDDCDIVQKRTQNELLMRRENVPNGENHATSE
jgi:hypothetical protein